MTPLGQLFPFHTLMLDVIIYWHELCLCQKHNIFWRNLMSTSQFVGHAASLSLNDLIRSADEMQNSGKVEEAANLYRQWLSHSRDPSKHVARFHYGWVLQKLNLFEEAQNVQRDFINDYAKHISGGTVSIH